MSKNNEQINKRKIIQLIMWWFLPVIIIGGIFWPYLGYLVVAMVIFFLVMASFKGRYWCGWLCPRGSFLERILSLVSRKGKVPLFLKNMAFRWIVFILLMGFMVFRLIQTEGVWAKIGFVFVTMCLVTTVIAIPLGIIFKPRTWCAFCPMGTLQGMIGGRKHLLKISDECTKCKLCEKVCPIGTSPVSFKADGKIKSVDCIKCPDCSAKCPKKALGFK